jgi:hypothetical protein
MRIMKKFKEAQNIPLFSEITLRLEFGYETNLLTFNRKKKGVKFFVENCWVRLFIFCICQNN